MTETVGTIILSGEAQRLRFELVQMREKFKAIEATRLVLITERDALNEKYRETYDRLSQLVSRAVWEGIESPWETRG